ncbi:MAG: tetratricopeptide repeat protein [Betaproteobacteria bacterium]|nr:tetratricopeptide repeat protein [Betaproteobacteria bacterium]
MIARGNRAETEGNLHEACEQYRKAVNAAPGYARAQLNLGTGLEAIGDADGAILSYEATLAIDPANAYASYNLGRLLYARGALARAEERLHSALEHKPGFPEALVVLSSVYDAQGNPAAAAEALEVALSERPDWVGALFNYGTVLKRLERLPEAEAALRRVIAVDPGNADASYELANVLYARGALQEAESLLRLVLERKPGFQEGYRALFYVHDSQGNLNAAAAVLEAALKQWPDWDDALRHYGATLRKLERLTEAEGALRRAIAAAPGVSSTHQALGTVLLDQFRIVEALEAFRVARELDPDSFELESSELFALNFSDAITDDALFSRHRAFGVRLENAKAPRFEPFRNVTDAGRRLRIGYVSGDFNQHPVTFFLMPLLERHDRSVFEIFCYSVGTQADDFTRKVQAHADIWREAAAMSYARLADTVNRDGIDILVDLSGHSGESRLAVFAQHPAPVQVAWLGYPSTSGLARIQYRLCDRYTDPPGATDHLYTETLLRLPHSQWCYRPLTAVDVSEVPPFKRNGYITFGSFNHVKKLSPSVRSLWAEILKRLPDSRLVVAGVAENEAKDSLLRDFEGAGVSANRVIFLPHVASDEYFRRFNAVDIALDSTPYSGCTTTFDTLWMAVPVITVPGTMPASRVTAGILSALGLTEWIALTPEDYVRLAIGFARDGALLTKLRETLRQRMRTSPIMDEVRFARDIEEAYRRMWRTWCSGAMPHG